MGKIYVVGLGPGAEEDMTERAKEAVEKSDVIAGYGVYTDLLGDKIADKKIISTPMKQEMERCRLAVCEAAEGKTVSMVCSGDAGIYGMAGLIYQTAQDEGLMADVDIEVVPGITAASSGAAVLGAPLIHDFAVISMSDLLTPMELIEKRLRCAAEADFVICIYNPSSKKRKDYLKKACDIISEFRSADTVCGYVRNIGRTGQEARIMKLEELRDEEVDMFTTVFVGNSNTKNIGGKMVTPRGYDI